VEVLAAMEHTVLLPLGLVQVHTHHCCLQSSKALILVEHIGLVAEVDPMAEQGATVVGVREELVVMGHRGLTTPGAVGAGLDTVVVIN
jgi:hypothetical protein